MRALSGCRVQGDRMFFSGLRVPSLRLGGARVLGCKGSKTMCLCRFEHLSFFTFAHWLPVGVEKVKGFAELGLKILRKA